MAREVKYATVPSLPNCRNRDMGKNFVITEWDAIEADRWIQRVTAAVISTGGQLPIDLRGAGWEGIALMTIGAVLKGGIDPDVMIPLGEQLLECVKIIPDKAHPESARDANLPGDIEEVQTRWWLRDQVVSVHTNFSFAAALSLIVSQIMAKAPTTSSNTST